MTDTFVRVSIEGHTQIDFDSRIFRVGLRKAANKVKLSAKEKLARLGISHPGEFPGMRTGDTRSSIQTIVRRNGWTAIVEPRRTSHMHADKFYPAILIRGRKRKIIQKGKREGRTLGELKPRRDPVVAAFEDRHELVRAILAESLNNALAFRK